MRRAGKTHQDLAQACQEVASALKTEDRIRFRVDGDGIVVFIDGQGATVATLDGDTVVMVAGGVPDIDLAAKRAERERLQGELESARRALEGWWACPAEATEPCDIPDYPDSDGPAPGPAEVTAACAKAPLPHLRLMASILRSMAPRDRDRDRDRDGKPPRTGNWALIVVENHLKRRAAVR